MVRRRKERRGVFTVGHGVLLRRGRFVQPYQPRPHDAECDVSRCELRYPNVVRGGNAEGWQKHHFSLNLKHCAALNVMWDITSLRKYARWRRHSGGTRVFWGRFDDSMLAHAVLWSELPHTLEFLESVCSPHPKMKPPDHRP